MRTKPINSPSVTQVSNEELSWEEEMHDNKSLSSEIFALDLHPFEIVKKCPTINSVICKYGTKEDISSDDVDMLQFELEKLLFHNICVHKKYKQAIEEPNYSVSGRKLSPGNGIPSQKSRQRHQIDAGKRSGSVASLCSLKIRPPKIQRTDHVTISERSAVSPGSSRSQIWPHNQMPAKFLKFVECFTGRLNESDLTSLRNIMEECADLVSSSHSTNTSNGHESVNKKIKNGFQSTAIKKNVTARSSKMNIRKTKVGNSGNFTKLGPLTEHLIQAMITEHPLNGNNGWNSAQFNGTTNGSSVKAFVKSLNIGNLSNLERLVRQELKEQGLLHMDDDHVSVTEITTEDEVVKELEQRRKELSLLQQSNLNKLTILLNKAEKQIDRQNLELSLLDADQEIISLCSKFNGGLPVSKRPSSKKEKRNVMASN